MSKPAANKTRSNRSVAQDEAEDLVPVSTLVPQDVRAVIVTEGEKQERNVSAQTRFILKEWAEKQLNAK